MLFGSCATVITAREALDRAALQASAKTEPPGSPVFVAVLLTFGLEEARPFCNISATIRNASTNNHFSLTGGTPENQIPIGLLCNCNISTMIRR
jgi:hypothetical protein